MKCDALFQLGIVSVCLHTTQTENHTWDARKPGNPTFRLSAGSPGTLCPSSFRTLKQY